MGGEAASSPGALGAAPGNRPLELGAVRRVGPWLAGALLLLPFALVTFPPAVDLPQHAALVRLWEELLGWRPATVSLRGLEALPFHPHALVYVPMLVLRWALDPVLAAKLSLALCVAAWGVAVWRVGRARGVPAEGLLLAAAFVYSKPLYWGFMNFLAGAPLMLVAVHLARPHAAWSARTLAAARAAVFALLLYAHSLWFAFAAAVTLAEGLRVREGLRAFGLRLASLAPVTLAALVWFPALVEDRTGAGFRASAKWFVPLGDRVSFLWVEESVLGGLRGMAEPLLLACSAVYVAASVVTHGRRWRPDGTLLVAGVLGLAITALGPESWAHTIMLNSRFAPFACGLVLMAVPLPAVPRVFVRGLAAGAFGLFLVVTAAGWAAFEAQDHSGLRAAIGALPDGARVLGLDYRKESEVVRGRPFLHTFAWAQVAHGGEGQFSFAEHNTGVVRYREKRATPWTPRLEWYAERATPADFAHFGYALVGASDAVHERFRLASGAEPLTSAGQVRAYRLRGRVPGLSP